MESRGEGIRANTWGRYYVSAGCDACGLCAECAPGNFGLGGGGGAYYLVAEQPATDRDERAVRDAMAACPRQCIHDDGDE
jgi:ferredoxin